MKYFLLIILFAGLLTGCSSEIDPVEEEINFFESDTIPLKDKMKRILESEYLLHLGFNEEQQSWLQDYYAKRDYKPHWINDSTLADKGRSFSEDLKNSLWIGIPENRLKITKKKKLLFVEEEVLLTAKAALITHDLQEGFLDLSTKKYLPTSFADIDKVDSLLKLPDSLPYLDRFQKLGVDDTNYRFLADHLYAFCNTYPLDKGSFQIKPQKTDTLHSFSMTRKALISKGYVSHDVSDSLTIVKAIKLFQKHNGLKEDGKVGAHTATALNESTYNKVLRAALSLEKLRHKHDFPEKFIHINLPEYTLRLYVHDSLKQVHRIICGKPENQTPELHSKIRNIVVYPYWNVPYSIASKEILPEVKRSTSYLPKNNYKIFRNDIEVNPYHVNWKKIRENSFPYKVRQEPGPKNSLGIIKFEFYNNYSVYVHDTPTKYLFKTDVRSYSHGCMRCENPVDLGKTLLDYDSIRRKRNDLTADSLDSLLTVGENYSIKLKDPVPIFIEYSTVTADRERMIFYLDIYLRDEEYLKVMKD